jgi:Tol biopolymer transport system component
VTSDAVGAFFPVWMPDGDRLIYASAREGPWQLFWRAVALPDSGRIHAPKSPNGKYPTHVTPDGRHLLFYGDDAVWILPLGDASRPTRLVQGMQGRVSPDGRWLAYTSEESGRREVYVTAFPAPQRRWRVSTEGGEDPQWRGDARELFFLNADRTLVAATVAFTSVPHVQQQRRLFRTAIEDRLMRYGAAYAPDAKGQRFLIIEQVDAQEIVLTTIENWVPGEH